MEQPREEKLWKKARRRAEFRKNLYSYIVVNAFLWAIWWFTVGHLGHFDFPWPLWVMLGLGIGLARQYYFAYYGDHDDLAAEKEYEKLKRNQGL